MARESRRGKSSGTQIWRRQGKKGPWNARRRVEVCEEDFRAHFVSYALCIMVRTMSLVQWAESKWFVADYVRLGKWAI